MVYAIEEAIQKELKKREEQGIEQGRIETAKGMIAEGESVEKIMKYTKLVPEKIKELKKEMKY